MPDSAPNESPSGTRSAAWRRWASVQPILDAALDAAPEDRIRIVTEMCGDDAELFATVRELLAYSTAESELFRDEVAVAYPKFVSSVFRSVPVGSNTARNELRAALANRYDIERVLGVGGMATVYLARDIRHDRRVALKVMSPELASAVGSARFLAEITTTASLQHPHILPLHDSGEVNGTVFYVMPYVEGGSLRDRLHREKQLPIHDALAIAIGVLGALDHAHRKGFVHRDIKPENILLNDGQPLVADFGIALGIATRHQEARARLTEHGASIGTPTYMSPEQATGDRELDGRTDIFALSCVLYEMLAGEPPHVGATTAEIIAKVLTTPPVSPRVLRETIPPHIEDAILIALQKLPADRYSTAADFANALEHPARNRPKRSFENATISARSFHSRWPLTLSAAVLAALGVWGWMRPTSRQGAAPLTRFSFALNASLPIAEIAVAPDGEAVVYVGGDSLVAGKLMLRRLDGEEPVAIPGTAGASQPFFSPDGLTIGFLQGGKLRRVSLASNEVSTLVDVAAMEGSTTLNQVMYGATWGPRDRIVFATPRGLYGVSASGGTPVRIALPDSSANQWYFQQPVFSHDGKDVLFGVVSRDYASHIAVMSTADRAIISLGVTGREPKFVAPSALVYTDADGRLFSIALDLPARRVVGQATKILDNVALSESPPRAYADISRRGTIAYVSKAAESGRELQLVDRRGVARSLTAERMAWRHPRFSPDGRSLAVGVDVSGAGGDIWILDLNTHRFSRLTFDSLSIHPGWSRDGSYVVYPHPRLIDGHSGLFRMRADGSGRAETLLVWPRQIWETEFAPDGKTLLFRDDNPRSVRDIYRARLDSSPTPQVLLGSAFNDRGIALAPIAEWMAYVSDANGRDEVYIRRTVEGSSRWTVSMSGGAEPRWSRDGRELFFRKGDTLFATTVDLRDPPTVGTPKALFVGQYQSSLHQALYDPSPNGQEFVMVKQVGGDAGLTVHFVLKWFDRRGKVAIH